MSGEYAAALAPHPWDALGQAPPLGLPYPGTVPAGWAPPEVVQRALDAAAKLRQADQDRDMARDLEDSARDNERDADRVLDELARDYGALVEAIRDDPYGVDNADDVLRVLVGGEV